MSNHQRSESRPRYARIGVASVSMAVTMVAALGGLGALPSAAQEPAARGVITAVSSPQEPPASPFDDSVVSSADGQESTSSPERDTALPARSGTGRRVVFSESRQRVWLVTDRRDVRRTYLVSGSIYDNLDPGTYSVYSRSEQAWGIDDSGTMKYFVRFAHGDTAAIGFHDIPVDDGERVQTPAQLGTPLSHGCIRQLRADAIALWEFAPLGTTVVVTA